MALAPARWSAGNPFIFVPLRSLDAIARSRARHRRGGMRPSPTPARSCSAAQTIEAGNAFHARMFAPHLGVLEDPATGSAAAAFAGWAARHGGLATASTRFAIEQGYEMGRPSQITLSSRCGREASRRLDRRRGDRVVSEGTIEA